MKRPDPYDYDHMKDYCTGLNNYIDSIIIDLKTVNASLVTTKISNGRLLSMNDELNNNLTNLHQDLFNVFCKLRHADLYHDGQFSSIETYEWYEAGFKYEFIVEKNEVLEFRKSKLDM